MNRKQKQMLIASAFLLTIAGAVLYHAHNGINAWLGHTFAGFLVGICLWGLYNDFIKK